MTIEGRPSTPSHPAPRPERFGLSGRIALVGFAAIAAYFLWAEHRAHVAQALPWVLLGLCPLMHVFMHRSHDHGPSDPRPGGAHGKQP